MTIPQEYPIPRLSVPRLMVPRLIPISFALSMNEGGYASHRMKCKEYKVGIVMKYLCVVANATQSIQRTLLSFPFSRHSSSLLIYVITFIPFLSFFPPSSIPPERGTILSGPLIWWRTSAQTCAQSLRMLEISTLPSSPPLNPNEYIDSPESSITHVACFLTWL